MSFEFRDAVRDDVRLLISIAGQSGAGKTKSALRLARGLVDGDDRKIFVLDTENKRALNYAPPKGQKPTDDTFGFRHGELRAPFSPERYVEGIEAAEAAGAAVIIVDSFSHSYEGEGGIQDAHDEILEREIESARKFAAQQGWKFDADKTADRLSMGAWKEPKARMRRLVARLLRCNAHIIFGLRADEKLRVEKVKDGNRERTVITQAKDLPPAERWTPICEKRFPYEMTASFVLSPQRPGYPIPIKLQDAHAAFFPLNKPIDEEAGRKMAAWASGESAERAAHRERVKQTIAQPEPETENAAPIAPAPEPPAAEARDPEAGTPAEDPVDQRAFPLDTVVMMKPHGHDPSHTPWKFSLPSEVDDFLIAWGGEFDGRVAEKDSIGLQALWQSNAAMLKAVEQGAPDIYRQVAKLKDAAKARLGVTNERRRG